MSTQKSSKHELKLTFRRASLLDIPLIFQLMQDGAEYGSFATAYVERTGSVKLLAYILRSITLQHFQSIKLNVHYEWTVILSADKDVGFLKIRKCGGACKDRTLELLAIVPENHNMGIGTAVLNQLVAEVPIGGELYAHCTKYARAMQHILKKMRLKRNVQFGVPNLEEYRTNLSGPGESEP